MENELSWKGRIGRATFLNGITLTLARGKDDLLYAALTKADGEEALFRPIAQEIGEADKAFGVLAGLYKRDGRIAVLTKSVRGTVLYSWIEDAKEVFRQIEWKEIGEPVGEDMVVCERCQGGLEVFRLDHEKELWHMWTNPKGEWSEWQSLGGELLPGLIVFNNEEGFPQVVGRFPDGSVAGRRHHNDGMWGPWTVLPADGGQGLTLTPDRVKQLIREMNGEGDLWL